VKRFVAHIIEISPQNILRDGFIEIDDSGKITSIRPLEQGEEPSNTKLLDGVITSTVGSVLIVGMRMPVVAVENVKWVGRYYRLTEDTTFRML
jgi:hypothetical protein